MYIQGGLLNCIVVLTGVLLLSDNALSLRGSALVAELKAKARAALLAPTEIVEEVVTVENNSTGNATNVTVVKPKSLLTGNPQKDYIYDPNLPRELNGYNLSDYPFYNAVPENITFKCDGLHDGFYASVPHKCQLYHHCLFGTRYDFLCANYTAFDQKTFICHFVSEIDCDNSPKHYDRNEALYKSASTAAPITTTTTTQRTTTSTQAPTSRPRRRRPYRRRRPAYDYYYDDEYDDEEYYDDEDIPPPPRRKMNRKYRPQHGSYRDEEATDDIPETRDAVKPNVRPNGPTVSSVYARPRAPPKVRRPVPINERDKYEYKPPEDGDSGKDSQKIPKGQQKKQRVEDDEYYDEDDYEEEQPLPKKKNKPTDYHGESTSMGESHRSGSRFRQRQPNQRKHDRYEDEYDEDDRPTRPSRKQMRHEEYSRPSRPNRDRTNHRTYLQEDPKEAVPAERPGYISSDRVSSGSRKQTESESSRSRVNKKPARPIQEDDEEYYDDEEEEEEVEDTKVTSRKNQRYGNSRGKDQAEYDYPEEAKGRSPNQERNRGKLEENPVESPRTSSRSKDRTSPRVSGRTEADEATIKTGSSSGRTVQKNNRKFSRPTVEVEDDEDDYEEEEYDEKPPQTNKRNNERAKQNTKQFTGQKRGSGSSSTSEEPSHKVSITSPGVSSILPSNQNQGLVRGNFRNKNTKEETPTSTTTFRPTSSQYDDYDDKKSTSRPGDSLDPKSRINQPTYDKDQETAKVKMVTESKDIEYDDYSESTSRLVAQSSKSDDSYDRTSAPALTRPSIGLFRRPTKLTKSEITTSSPAPNFRRPISDTSEDERPQQRNGPTGSGQYLRRVKVETSKQENLSNPQPKFSNTGGYFKRLEKTADSPTFDYLGNSQSQDGPQQPPLINNTNKYSENQPTRIGVKRVKLVDVQVRDTLRPSDDYKEIEQLSTTEESINNFNKPSANFRPINNAKNKDESIKIPITPSSALFRRPLKQRLKEVSLVDLPTDSPLPKQSSPSETGGNYDRPESEAIITFRSNKGYLNQNRGKVPFEDDSTRLVKNSNVELLSRNPPNIDITAPGPSGGGIDSVSIRSDYRDSHTPSGFTLDIPEEEYDVTLNDALQPSTLHPTRSLVDYQQNRFKARGFQTTIPQPTGFSSRGTASFLTPAASQQYISQVQSTNNQNRGTQPSGSDAYIEKETNKGRQQTSDSQRYEALVLTAPANQQWINRNPRLTEWFW